MNLECINLIEQVLKQELESVISSFNDFMKNVIEPKYGTEWLFSSFEEFDRLKYVELSELKRKVSRVYNSFIEHNWV